MHNRLTLFFCLTLVACGQGNPGLSLMPGDHVTLTIAAPNALRPQYVNTKNTSRVDVQIDSGSATSFTLGSANAPCANGSCTLDLGLISPGQHTFQVSTFGTNASQHTVLISQGRLTQTLAPGQNTALQLTLTPTGVSGTLQSAVQQYNRTTGRFGNYINFPTRAGRSLPAYYDVSAVDSVGDPIPSVLCSNNTDVVIRPISNASHPNRYRVEVQALGQHSLIVHTGTSCTAGGTAVFSQPVTGVLANDTTPVVVGSGGVGFEGHSLAVLSDGTVRAWGLNSSGQLGNASAASSTVPTPVIPLAGAVSVSAGAMHSLALLADGTVRAWGLNNSGQLGNGTKTNSALPVQVSNLNDVVSVSAGDMHSLALLADGTLRAWGQNFYGQLGNGTTISSTVPVPVGTLGHAVFISAGLDYNLVVLATGTVWAWGSNPAGELGIGSNTLSSTTPVQVHNLTGAVMVSAGYEHSLAVLTVGTVRAWGRNNIGQLGTGTTTDSTVPVVVSNLTGAVGVASGAFHSLALLGDGSVWSWGANGQGQLGTGMPANSSVPVVVPGLAGAVSVASGDIYSLAVRTGGSVLAWGANENGQLGDGSTTFHTAPVFVSGLTTVPAPTR